MTDASLEVRVLSDVGHLNLRGDPHHSKFKKATQAVLGQSLPVDANTISDGEHRVFWLGPDEWLITTAAGGVATLLARLEKALADQHAAINDISGGNVALRLAGENARDLFAKGCTLDFHPDAFQVGTCAQSGLAKANVLFGLIDERPTFDIIVRRSFSDYLLQWLTHAGSDYGIVFL